MIKLSEVCDNRELFSQRGIKNTKQRNIIYDILKETSLPLTAEQVYVNLLDIDKTMNFSTIYRILETFVSKGLVVKSNMTNDNKTMYELSRIDHRHYLTCIKCKKIITIDSCPLEKLERDLAEATGFSISGHKLEVLGNCPDCQ